MLRHFLITAGAVILMIQPLDAQDWQLKSTTPSGTGGHFENGQKVRVDAGFKNGTFSFERKVTSGKSMQVYSAKAEFGHPAKSYAPGEDIGIQIRFSESGDRNGYNPYARVSVRTSAGESQLADAVGRTVVLPPETVTLMGNAPVSGNEMSIVLSCNGMDVVYLYTRDAAAEIVPVPPVPVNEPAREVIPETVEPEVTAEPEAWEPETTAEPEAWEPETAVEPEDTFEPEENIEPEPKHSWDDIEFDEYEDDEESLDLKKILIVAGIAILLIAAILLLFRKKEPKAEKPRARTCPNCGAALEPGAHFCAECGQKID